MKLDKVKEIVANPLPMEDNQSLNLYRGYLGFGRAQALWNYVRTSMLLELMSYTEISRLSREAPDLIHLCGIHAKSVQVSSLRGFLNRLWYNPQVTQNVTGLREYIGDVGNGFFFKYERIPRYNKWSTQSWRRPKKERKPRAVKLPAPPPVPSFYPFVSEEPLEEHTLLMAVHDIVPEGLPEQIRRDVCQDIIVSILSGETQLENLRGDIKPFISKVFKEHSWKYGPISMNAPLSWDEGGWSLEKKLVGVGF